MFLMVEEGKGIYLGLYREIVSRKKARAQCYAELSGSFSKNLINPQISDLGEHQCCNPTMPVSQKGKLPCSS